MINYNSSLMNNFNNTDARMQNDYGYVYQGPKYERFSADGQLLESRHLQDPYDREHGNMVNISEGYNDPRYMGHYQDNSYGTPKQNSLNMDPQSAAEFQRVMGFNPNYAQLSETPGNAYGYSQSSYNYDPYQQPQQQYGYDPYQQPQQQYGYDPYRHQFGYDSYQQPQQQYGYDPYQYQQPIQRVSAYQQPNGMHGGYNMNAMGTYYNNGMNGYYNPYMMQQHQRQMEMMQYQEQMRQIEIFKSMSRSVNRALGMSEEDIEEHIKRRYDTTPISRPGEMTEEEKELETLIRLQRIEREDIRITPLDAQRQYAIARERERMRKIIPDDMGLADFFEAIGEEAYRLDSLIKKRTRSLRQMYDSNEYRKLLRKYSPVPTYLNTFSGNIDNNTSGLSNMEISPPLSIQEKMQARRQAFLDSIPKG